MIDYATPADRIGTSLDAKRARAIAYLRSRGKYIVDADCNFRPTSAADTDIRRTWRRWAAETGNPLPAWLAELGDVLPADADLPCLMRKQAA